MIVIYSADGFVRKFWERTKQYKFYKEAYESVEEDHVKIFGKRKY